MKLEREWRTEHVCAVCGRGGYWVAFDSVTGEDRCNNHVGIPCPSAGLCLQCGMACTNPSHDAPEPS